MKTNKKIIYILFLFIVVSSSCKKDFLDRVPQNQLSQATFWKTEEDLFKAVNDSYASILTGDGVIYEDAKSDNAYGQYPWESTATITTSGDITSAADAGWSYGGIRGVNLILENADKIPMDEARKNRYKAEARFLRAFSYINLINRFGDVPLVTSVLEIADVDVPRTPKAQVYKFIIDELTAVAEILPVSYPGGKYTDKGRITKGAALALKARIALYNNDWQVAIDATNAVKALNYSLFKLTKESGTDLVDDYAKWVTFTDASDQSKFRLGLRSYEQMFWKANKQNSEVILDRQYITVKDVNYLNTYLPPSVLGGWSSVVPTQELVNDYLNYKTGEPNAAVDPVVRANLFKSNSPAFYDEYKNRDPRFYATIMFATSNWNAIQPGYSYSPASGNNNSTTGYNFRKLVDPEIYNEQVDNYSNVILLRYAEILLTYAEAKNELSGPDATVYKAIDDLRDRVGMPHVNQTTYSTQATLRNLIRRERRIELALEGQRYMDIRRWKIAPQVMKTTYDIRNTLVQTRTWTDKLYLMPVPQSQIDLSNHILTQNAGY